MSNADLLNQADKILRPVLSRLTKAPWIKVTNCCAGHEPEDSVWIEMSVRGSSGLDRLIELLRMLEKKLTGTSCRTDCLLNYGTEEQAIRNQHGWFPMVLEAVWPSKEDWRQSQALIVEALLSSIETLGDRIEDDIRPEGAIVYCPYCGSSFIKLVSFELSEHQYLCGDCETPWTLVDPSL